MRAVGMSGLLSLAALFGGCGAAASSFPEETACPAPSPVATSRANPGTISPQAYLRRLQEAAVTLEKLRAELRVEYPEDTFYRREEFRPDFAEYASQTVCAAQAMFELAPPDARFSAHDAKVDAALTDLIAHTRAGREAVRSRNVSDYRDWYSGVDARIAAVRLAASEGSP